VVRIREKALKAKAKELRTTNAIEQEAKRVAEEMMNSPKLKVFRYVPKRKRTPHLYAETSNGTKFPLCGKPVDETVAASQIKTIRGDECAMCKRAAEEIFNREAN
jgi:hypothetical protein